MPYFYYGDFLSFRYMLLVAAILFAALAQARVTSNFNKYSALRNHRGITGAEAARMMLDSNGLVNVRIERIRGKLTDHYDPRNRVLRLSDSVYGESSVSAVSVACHEAGHALQHANNYVPLKVRNGIVPLVNFSSRFAWILIFLGIVTSAAGSYISDMAFNIGILMFVAVIVFHLITLPVEFNASSRAMEQMELAGIIDADEKKPARKVLSAAAMTYVASLTIAIAQLIRRLAIRDRD